MSRGSLRADFVLADVRDATAAEKRARRLNAIVGRLGATASRALIIEDLNHLEDTSVLLSLGAVASALRRRDRVGLITSYHPPSPRGLGELGLERKRIVEVPYFSEGEVKAVVQANGGDPDTWGSSHIWPVGTAILSLSMLSSRAWRCVVGRRAS